MNNAELLGFAPTALVLTYLRRVTRYVNVICEGCRIAQQRCVLPVLRKDYVLLAETYRSSGDAGASCAASCDQVTRCHTGREELCESIEKKNANEKRPML